MLDDLPWGAWHIRGFQRKDVFVVVEEVDERAFLFGGERGTYAYCFTLGAAGVYEDLFGALCQFERPGRFLCVGRFFDDLLPEGSEFPRGDDCCGVAAALDFALVSPLEGGANGDDPVWACHLQLEVCVVGDSHELRVAWSSQDGVEGSTEPNYLEGEGLGPIIELIPEGDGQINLS